MGWMDRVRDFARITLTGGDDAPARASRVLDEQLSEPLAVGKPEEVDLLFRIAYFNGQIKYSTYKILRNSVGGVLNSLMSYKDVREVTVYELLVRSSKEEEPGMDFLAGPAFVAASTLT